MSSDLLIELSTMDEANAWVPTPQDQDAGLVPNWCELVLEFKRTAEWPLSAQLPLRRHDGELLATLIHEALHPTAGGSTREMVMMELDEVVDRIQRRVAKGKTPKAVDVGLARGLATAVAIMTNPYAYDVDSVREEAMERFNRK